MTEKRRRRLVDFDDLLRLAARDLAADPVYASARHWRFRHLFVDEFQDVNPLQYALLSAWLGPESDLCVVGDPNQAIYAWNGADAQYLIDFDHWFPGGESVTLEDNYRSTPQILIVANAVLDAGRNVPITLRPHRPDGPMPTVDEHADETAEARAIARRVRDGRAPGAPWSAQAVLVRTNAQAAVIAEVLNSANIPHRVRGGGDLMEQPEVRQALGALRRATSLQMALGDLESEVLRLAPPAPDDGLPGAGTDGSQGAEPSELPTSMPSGTAQLTEERAANLNELVRLGREYLSLDPHGGVPGFLGWLSSALRGEDRSGGDAVEIVTFHAAKGLEWSIVHLAGLEDGFVPIHHAKDSDDDLEEERRLLYVALTRARDQLHCTWATSRTFGSRSAKRQPSPWLPIIASTVGIAPLQVDRRSGVQRARAVRASLPKKEAKDLPDGDRELFEELRAWRRKLARRPTSPHSSSSTTPP